jgi:hypothetical protein
LDCAEQPRQTTKTKRRACLRNDTKNRLYIVGLIIIACTGKKARKYCASGLLPGANRQA